MLRRRRVVGQPGNQQQPQQPQQGEDGEEDNGEAGTEEGKKVSAKKQAKLAMKAQRAAEAKQREEERMERRKEDEQFWANREAERKKELEEQEKRALEEKKLEEEMEKRDQAEFDQWKGFIEVEESGSAVKSEEELQREADELVATLKRDKIVLLESLALQWDLTSAQVVERLAQLEEQGKVQGVVDERGKYIYVTPEEMEAIAKWVQRKGRVKLAALAAHSNKLVRLTSE